MRAMISDVQLRMARAALGLGVREVAELANVTPNTVSRCENGADVRVSTLARIQSVYEDAGIEFLVDTGKGPGVRLRGKTGIQD